MTQGPLNSTEDVEFSWLGFDVEGWEW